MTVSFLQDPGRSTDLLLKGPSIPSAACNVLVSKGGCSQPASSAFLVTELAVQDLTCAMDLPVPCMAEELERQCQRLDSLLEDEEYYATEDADPFFEPLFERIASIREEEDTSMPMVGSKRPAPTTMVVVHDEHTNSSCDHTPAVVPTATKDLVTTQKTTTTLIPAAATKASALTTKFTLPRKLKTASSSRKSSSSSNSDAVRANYDHYMSTGQPMAPGNWRGCMKSRQCDRESRHRGICNHKCVVPAPVGVCLDVPSPKECGNSAPPLKRVRVGGGTTAGRRGSSGTSGDDSDGDTMTPGTSHTNALGTWRDDAEVTMPATTIPAAAAADDEVSVGDATTHDAAVAHDELDATTTAATSVSLDEPFACFPVVREPWPQHRARLEALGLHHGVDLKSHLRKRFPSLATGFDPNDVGLVGQRQCTACSKQSTPVWRAGPTGPKSLCNACGVRHLKNFKRK